MKRSRLIYICISAATVCIFAISIIFIPGWLKKVVGVFGIQVSENHGITYWCPMHPDIKRTIPGICPICNMALVELREEAKAREEGVLLLSDRQIQQAGVRTDYVRYRDLLRDIDTSGRIAYDERRLAHITSWISGGNSRIERLYVDFTGQTVKEGELLMEIYSPSLITSIEEYRLAIEALANLKKASSQTDIQNASSIFESTRNRLLKWGLNEKQIAELETKKVGSIDVYRIPIYSPISGTVIEKLVKEGQYVSEGSMLLEIADLSTVWLLADIYEYELPFLKLGQDVEITLRSFPGKIFKGKVAFIEPFLQEETRTIRIRCDIDNKDMELKPGMYARARIRFEFPKILSVPESAVLHSGRREIVIIAEDGGRYKPVEVNLGRKWLYSLNPSTGSAGRGLSFGVDSERYHEVLDGLHTGEIVVVAGNFLLNAESQFQGILKKMLPAEEPQAEKKKEITLSSEIQPEIQKEMANIFEAYFTIQTSLADDSLNDIPEPIETMKESVESLVAISSKALEGSEAQGFNKYLNDLKTALESFKPDSDMVQTRIFFGDLSKHIIEYLKDFAGSETIGTVGNDLNLFSCPMAAGYGDWLQKGPDIKNPYMGKAMLRCGNRIKGRE